MACTARLCRIRADKVITVILESIDRRPYIIFGAGYLGQPCNTEQTWQLLLSALNFIRSHSSDLDLRVKLHAWDGEHHEIWHRSTDGQPQTLIALARVSREHQQASRLTAADQATCSTQGSHAGQQVHSTSSGILLNMR